jgi:hypothetical protein
MNSHDGREAKASREIPIAEQALTMDHVWTKLACHLPESQIVPPAPRDLYTSTLPPHVPDQQLFVDSGYLILDEIGPEVDNLDCLNVTP